MDITYDHHKLENSNIVIHYVMSADGGSRDGSVHVGGGDAGAAPAARVPPVV